jgi:hypothetical protein
MTLAVLSRGRISVLQRVSEDNGSEDKGFQKTTIYRHKTLTPEALESDW